MNLEAHTDTPVQLHNAPLYTVYIQSLTHAHTHSPSAKPLIKNMLVFTLHVYPDRSIQLIHQLLDLELNLTLTDRAPVHAHFTAGVQMWCAFVLFACSVSI